MEECRFPPLKFVYFGFWDGIGSLKASNTHKLGTADDRILPLDFIKEHLKNRGSSSPYISLFADLSALQRYLKVHGGESRHTTKPKLCEIDASKLEGVKLYRVKDIAPAMGVVANGPLPDYLALHRIPREAVRLIQ